MQKWTTRKNITFFLFLLFSFSSPSVWGWYEHRHMMPHVLESLMSHISIETRSQLEKTSELPCEEETREKFQNLIKKFDLNPNALLPPSFEQNCINKKQTSALEILKFIAIDDPDVAKIDQDLTSSSDPNNVRKWLGGSTGPSSQGFRHMYYVGWKLSHPLITLQIPLQALGEAPKRIQLFANEAKELFKKKDFIWGARMLAWALHYLQDLSQPFHVIQMIHPKMFSWSSLWNWPLDQSFQNFTQSTVRILTNYHWAYEGYLKNQLIVQNHFFTECLKNPKKFSNSISFQKNLTPENITESLVDASVQIAYELGQAEFDFFGEELKKPNYSLSDNPQLFNDQEFAQRPDLSEKKNRFHLVTCQALSHLTQSSHALIEWTLQP